MWVSSPEKTNDRFKDKKSSANKQKCTSTIAADDGRMPGIQLSQYLQDMSTV